MNIEKIIFVTGAIVWVCILLLAILFIAAFVWGMIKETVFIHWLSVMYARLTMNYKTMPPIHPMVLEHYKERLAALEKLGKRKFEQKEIKKFLSQVRVKKMESVFDN